MFDLLTVCVCACECILLGVFEQINAISHLVLHVRSSAFANVNVLLYTLVYMRVVICDLYIMFEGQVQFPFSLIPNNI